MGNSVNVTVDVTPLRRARNRLHGGKAGVIRQDDAQAIRGGRNHPRALRPFHGKGGPSILRCLL